MNYIPYIVTIVGAADSLKFIEVVASDIDSAMGDVRAAYGEDVDIVAIRVA